MVFGSCFFIYTLFENCQPSGATNLPLALGLFLYSFFAICVYLFVKDPVFFQTIYGLTVVATVARALYNIKYLNPCRQVKEGWGKRRERKNRGKRKGEGGWASFSRSVFRFGQIDVVVSYILSRYGISTSLRWEASSSPFSFGTSIRSFVTICGTSERILTVSISVVPCHRRKND